MTRLQGVVTFVVFAVSAPSALQKPDEPPRLMTFAEYARVTHALPYLLQLDSATRSLLYFGAKHIVGAPSDPQVQQIMDLWQTFKPTLALNEGWDPPVVLTAEQAVASYGEPGLIRFLAARDRVPCRNFEPRQAEEVAFLRQRYSLEEIKLFYVLRIVAENWRMAPFDVVDTQIQGQLSLRLALVEGLEGPPLTVADVEAAYRRTLPGMTSDWRRISVDDLDPAASKPNRLQALNADLALFRDAHIIDVLEVEVRRRERVFAVVGASHVVMQEQLLRARLLK